MNFRDEYGNPRPHKLIPFVIVVLFGLSVVFSSFGTIDEGELGVKTRFGEIASVYQPGLYFKIPFVEQMNTVSVRTQTVVYELENPLFAASKDQQDVDVATVVNYSIRGENVEEVYRKYRTLEAFEADVIRPTIRDTIKAGAAKFNAEQLITTRDEYSTTATDLLRNRFLNTSVIIERVNITNIKFSPQYTASIEAKVTAEQNALKAEQDLRRVEFEAEQRVAQSKAEAEAIRIQAEAITQQGGRDYVELQRIEKWNGQACTSYCGLDASTGLLINR